MNLYDVEGHWLTPCPILPEIHGTVTPTFHSTMEPFGKFDRLHLVTPKTNRLM